jgi:cytoskeletal protein RodZ
MAESTGAKLRQARLAKSLSLSDVAQATRIQPDKLAALESDDFSRFPSMAYGRGFLVIYGKHLGVDVTEQALRLEGHNAIHTKEYQYLHNTPTAPLSEDSIAPREQSPSFMPLLVLGGIVLLIVGIFWLLLTMRRVGVSLW